VPWLDRIHSSSLPGPVRDRPDVPDRHDLGRRAGKQVQERLNRRNELQNLGSPPIISKQTAAARTDRQIRLSSSLYPRSTCTVIARLEEQAAG